MEAIFDNIIAEEVAEHVVQLKERQDADASTWCISNAHQVTGARYFINDKLPSGEYTLLVIPQPNGNFTGTSMIAGICGLTTEDLKSERKQRLIFPNIDQIIALTVPNDKIFISQ